MPNNKAFQLRVTSLSPHQTGEAGVTPTLNEEVPLDLEKTMFSSMEKGLCFANPTPSTHPEAAHSTTGRSLWEPELHRPGLLSQRSVWISVPFKIMS